MAKGTSALNAKVFIGGIIDPANRAFGITSWQVSQDGTVLEAFGDDQSFPQQAATVEKHLNMNFTSNDPSAVSGNDIGEDLGIVQFVVWKNNPAGTVTYSTNHGVVTSRDDSGGYSNMGQFNLGVTSQGTDGIEPTHVLGTVV
ncbi:MAG: hypothetical protein M3447_09050 [Acidobacteriota bacterium]|nr:hypothetical protein [Acidobacteriota bacterium]